MLLQPEKHNIKSSITNCRVNLLRKKKVPFIVCQLEGIQLTRTSWLWPLQKAVTHLISLECIHNFEGGSGRMASMDKVS